MMERLLKFVFGQISSGVRLQRIIPNHRVKNIPVYQNVPNSSKQLKNTLTNWYGYAYHRFSSKAMPQTQLGMQNGSNSRPPNSVIVSLQWLPSSGVPKHMFGLHGIFPNVKRSTKPLQTPFINFELINAALKKDMETFWPNLKCYGDVSKYEKFWIYQWVKHGIYLSLRHELFFQAGVNFIKPLPKSLYLQVGKVTNIQDMLDVLKNLFHVSCAIVSDRVRGYIIDAEKKYFYIRALEEVRVGTDNTLVTKINMWTQLYKMASVSDKIVLPGDPLYRFRSLRDDKDILYAPGQANYNLLLREEHVKQRTREAIYMNKEALSFIIVEDEKGVRKLGVLSISIRDVFNPSHEAFLRFRSQTRLFEEIVVVVTRMESVNWQQYRFDKLTMEIKKHLPMHQLKPKKVTFLPISLEDNIKEMVDQKICSWYKGKCLYGFLEKFEMTAKNEKSPLRVIVHDIYVESDLVIGEVVAGTIHIQDDLLIMPEKIEAQVIEISDGDNSKSLAIPGELVQLRLSGSKYNVQKGCVLSSTADTVPLVYEFLAKICLFEDVSEGEKLYLFIHYMEVACEIKKINEIIDPVTKTYIVFSTIQVEEPVCTEICSEVPALGSFFLVREDRTVGSGRVIGFGRK